MTSPLLPPRWQVLLGALLTSAACTPEVQFPTWHVQEVTFSGVEVHTDPVAVDLMLDLKLDATNPNQFDLKVRTLRGNLTLDRHVLPVLIQPDLWLLSGQKTAFSVPVAVSAETALKLVGEAVLAECIPYKFEGSVDVTASQTQRIQRDGYPLSHEGCIPRRSLREVIKR